MQIKILQNSESIHDLELFARAWYPGFLKGTVDLKNKKVAVGGEWHIESLEVLVEAGGAHEDIWGFNILFPSGEIEYHSMVNIKPQKGYRDMVISEKDLIQDINTVLKNYFDFLK